MAIGQTYLLAVALLLNIFLTISRSYGADTISINKSLSGDETLVSSGGNFELGFFRPGNSSNYYIGMWYKKVSVQTIAWVANRETPVTDKYSSELKILDGNLVLLNKSNIPIWSTNVTSSASDSVLAILQDNGNLVLKNGLNSAFPLWESFDHPTHTWLPGGKIAYNKRTKTQQSITSWKNNEDPATGLYSLVPEPNGTQYFIMWNKTKPYWSSGSWNGQIFSLIPEMRSNYIYNFTFISNENESYFRYSVYNKSIISRLIIDVSGQVQQWTWLEESKQWNLFWARPRTQCEVYSRCGAFGTCQNSLPFCSCLHAFKPKSESDWNSDDHTDGCVRKTSAQCGNNNSPIGEKDGFLTMMLPDNGYLSDNPTQSLTTGNSTSQTCKSICLGNCSCTAYAYDNNGCLFWNREILNLQENGGNGRTIYVRVASSDLRDTLEKQTKGIVVHVILGSVLGVSAIFLALLILVLVWRRERRLAGAINTMGDSLVAFRYRDLQIATKNFSEKLGSGGFGSVFKGTFQDKTTIAVKKLETINHGDKQFRAEVSTIGTLQHVNLVRLRGFCAQGSNKLLVYDFLPKGSLDTNLFYEKVLDWKTRYQIALGIARGLFYLHEKCRNCIIHCDIKPENILLDNDFCPKISDFGLAKLIGRDFSRVLTTIRGTRGYLAPEWISGVAITAKADVYSYGMMLLELVSGKRNTDVIDGGKSRYYPSWAARVVVEDEDIFILLDERLDRIGDEEEMRRICRVACWCIQDDEDIRPSMNQVVQILEGVSDVHKPPIPRSFDMLVDNLQEP